MCVMVAMNSAEYHPSVQTMTEIGALVMAVVKNAELIQKNVAGLNQDQQIP